MSAEGRAIDTRTAEHALEHGATAGKRNGENETKAKSSG
jgi:hypothetical protein